MKRQKIALLAVAAAALGSIATSRPIPSWSIDAQATGPAVVLVTGTSGSSAATHHITTVVSAEAMDDDNTEGYLNLDAQACFTAVAGTAGTVAPPRLRVIVLDESEEAAGHVLEQPLPLCPSRIAFPLELYVTPACAVGISCSFGNLATFERLGDADEVHVDWTVSATIIDYGTDNPPAGAGVTVTID